MQIHFDQGPEGQAAWFENPKDLIIARTPQEVPAALKALDKARARGAWLAGYASYELGYALEERLIPLMPRDRRLPLICFGVYDPPGQRTLAKGPAGLQSFAPRWGAQRYTEAFDQVKTWIGAGDIYQANLTFPIDLQLSGQAEAIYCALASRQTVTHGALVLQDDGPDLLCRSPELFFRTDSQAAIQARPMKGTQPRADDPAEDARRRDFLASDEKNLAENLMIVDLLRNDLSRMCEIGSVRVPELFTIESYATVHQMTSQVEGRLQADVDLSQILSAIFPCGSITGAPKMRAMEVLHTLEPWARDIYCGSIGWAAPDGRASFNVAIRTLMLEDDGRAVMNVGGGVVWDSTAQDEYEEAMWKARFASQFLTEHS